VVPFPLTNQQALGSDKGGNITVFYSVVNFWLNIADEVVDKFI
jgi:hypothetical protein